MVIAMKPFFLTAFVSLFCLSQIDCGKNPAGSSTQGTGEIHVWAHVLQQQKGLSKRAKTTATTWDSLVVRITSSASAMDMMLKTFTFDTADPYVNYTLQGVPAGKARLIEVWTKNQAGLIIHACKGQTVDIAAGEIKTVDFLLVPKRGSIYIDISNIPVMVNGDTIEAVYAAFAFNSQTLSDSAKRSKNLFLSIDNVPDSASGTLFIAGLGRSLDTLYRSASPLTFYALKDTTFSVRILTVSTGVSFTVTAIAPGATVIAASLDSTRSISTEQGPLIISEIMYCANDSEYIEVYNPLEKDGVYDTLILDIDGTYRYFTNVTVPSRGFFVFGRKSLPWVNAVHPTASALDLLSGGGNVIALRAKNFAVMDWVAYLGGTNDQEWPGVSSGKKSIVLDSLAADPAYNNFGKHWRVAITLINNVDPKYASPQTLQCGTPGFKGE